MKWIEEDKGSRWTLKRGEEQIASIIKTPVHGASFYAQISRTVAIIDHEKRQRAADRSKARSTLLKAQQWVERQLAAKPKEET